MQRLASNKETVASEMGEWAGRIWSWKVNLDLCRSAAAGIGSAHRQCG
ncbi:hypothetical protein L195_g060880 [Trifolium pratense]|uniref:Uncharacterized protein n=1 Tax=Trifolium pratense TaxID=57577 RepID=A0A2K3K6I4_TRIPR|nr:hypothetical protein L195_g060880 [Trifolium pratense]